jgi:hypothetical protein
LSIKLLHLARRFANASRGLSLRIASDITHSAFSLSRPILG